jgi:hypothetical protein
METNYIQMLKAIMAVYTIKTGMSNIWQLSLNPSMVEAVTTAVGVAVSFIGGGNRSTWRKPSTGFKSLTNFIT